MAESHVVSALVKKRARLMGELSYHLEAVKRLESAIDAAGQSIKIFEPNYRLGTIKPIRRKRSSYFKQGECTRLVLDVLRESEVPMDMAAILGAVIDMKQLDPDELDMQAVNETVVNVLKGLRHRGVVNRGSASQCENSWSLA